jgi:hypothetical protein
MCLWLYEKDIKQRTRKGANKSAQTRKGHRIEAILLYDKGYMALLTKYSIDFRKSESDKAKENRIKLVKAHGKSS